MQVDGIQGSGLRCEEIRKSDFAGLPLWTVTRGFRKCYVLRRAAGSWDYGCGFVNDASIKRQGNSPTKRLAFALIRAHLEGGAA